MRTVAVEGEKGEEGEGKLVGAALGDLEGSARASRSRTLSLVLDFEVATSTGSWTARMTRQGAPTSRCG